MTGLRVGIDLQAGQRPAWRRCRRWTPRALALGAVLAGLLGPAGARAAGGTLYVDQNNPSCSTTGGGAAATPFCTISAAAANAGPGTTVVVASGTYNEQVKPPTSGAAGSPITFTTAPGAHVLVTGGAPGTTGKPAFYLFSRSWITISGFAVTTGDKGIYAVGGTNIVITDNDVTGCTHQGIQLNSVEASTVQDNTVDHNSAGIWLNNSPHDTISGNAVASNSVGIGLYSLSNANTVTANVIRDNAQGVYASNSTDNLIANNAIANPAMGTSTSGYAIGLFADDFGPQLCTSAGCGATANPPTVGNRVLANSIAQYAPASAVNVDGGSSKTTLANNVIAVMNPHGGAAVRLTATSVPGSSLDYDLLTGPAGKLISWSSTYYASLAAFATATGQEAHGIQAPAGFADPVNGNLSLTPGSPAIDSGFAGWLGTPVGLVQMPPTDAWGGARVDDAATPNTGAGIFSYADRGAYEMRNTGFEANTAGWNAPGGIALTQVAGGHTGNGAALLTNAGTTTATCALNDSPNIVRTTTAGTYTATLWVRADSPGATLVLRLREWVGSSAVGDARTYATLSNQWQPVTVQYTVVDPGSSTLDFNAYITKAAPGNCFYADDASIAAG